MLSLIRSARECVRAALPTNHRLAWVSLAIALFAGIPAHAAQWTTHGPYGGQVTVLAIDPQAPANLYAAGYSGVFKSSDGGANWARSSNGITDPSVAALAIDPANPTTLYAGSIHGGSVVKSVDGAATWSPIAGAPTLVVAMAINPQVPSILYASRQQSGILKSTNSGTNWGLVGVATLPSFPTFKTLVVDPVTPATLYAGEQSMGVYKSVNGGTSWAPANTGFSGPVIQILALAIDPHTPATLYAAASTSGGAGLFKTVDGGAHWTNILAESATVSGIDAVAVDPQNPSTIYVGTFNGVVLKSTTGGTGFAPIQTGLPKYAMNVLAVSPQNPATVYAGTQNGVFATTNGGAGWNVASNGLALTTVSAVAVDPATPTTIYAGTTLSGIFKSVDGGDSWLSIYTGLGTTGNLACGVPGISSLAIDPAAPGTIYAGTECTLNSQVLKSTNGGANWVPAATGLPAFARILSLAIDPLATSNVYAGSLNFGVFRSPDGGATWPEQLGGLPDNPIITSISVGKTQLAVMNRDDGVYVATIGGGTTSLTRNKSFNSGPMATSEFASDPVATVAGWTIVQALQDEVEEADSRYFSSGSKEDLENLHDAQQGLDESIGWFVKAIGPQPPPSAGTAAAQSSDTWVATRWAPPTGVNSHGCFPAPALVVDPNVTTSFYVGAACGVLKGTDNGQKMVALNAGLLPNQQINALAITAPGDMLYAGAANGGVYTLSLLGAGNLGSAFSRNYVEKAYVAYYGRAADPAGQDYWALRLDAAGGSLDAIIDAFGNSDEFNRRYGGLTNTALVTKIYQQTLGRNPEQGGLDYYVGELNAHHRTLQSITLDVLNGATTPPDSTVVANKLVVAAYYTAKVAAGCAYGTEQDGVSTLSAVTANAGTVTTAKAALDARCGP